MLSVTTILHKLLQDQGYAGALLVPGDDGLREMYQRKNYVNCTAMNTILSASQPETVPIHPIDREEYGKLRRTLLPKNGVIQEGENLLFLETQYKLYTGPGFLLCARPKTEVFLEGAEFLGDPALLPGILCALGYPHGSFRMPGEAIPFAMICLLKKDAPVPGYFGLAFD